MAFWFDTNGASFAFRAGQHADFVFKPLARKVKATISGPYHSRAVSGELIRGPILPASRAAKGRCSPFFPFLTDLVTVQRSELRSALQPRAQTPHDFIPGFCRPDRIHP